MTEHIPAGIIPDSKCPYCGAELLVINKINTQAQNPQFVGCTNYTSTGCNYRRKVNDNDRVIMKKMAAEFAAQPAEF